MRKLCRPIEAPEENQSQTQQAWRTGLKRVMTALSRQPNVQRALLLEYGKLYWPTTDLPLCSQQLEELANEISANASCATGETNWLRLSGILSGFASKC